MNIADTIGPKNKQASIACCRACVDRRDEPTVCIETHDARSATGDDGASLRTGFDHSSHDQKESADCLTEETTVRQRPGRSRALWIGAA
jgi:hypothetical protein